VLAVVALGIGTLLAACSSTPERDELVDALTRAGLSRAEAECATAALYDNLTDDQIGAIAERGPSAVIDDTDDPDEPIDIARREIAACRTEHDSATTTTSAADPASTTEAGAASTEPIDDPSTTEPEPTDPTTTVDDGAGSETTLGPGTSLPKEPPGTPTTVRPPD